MCNPNKFDPPELATRMVVAVQHFPILGKASLKKNQVLISETGKKYCSYQKNRALIFLGTTTPKTEARQLT